MLVSVVKSISITYIKKYRKEEPYVEIFFTVLSMFMNCVPPSGYQEGFRLHNILPFVSFSNVCTLDSMVYLYASYRWKFVGWLVARKGGLRISLEICQGSTERL